MSLIQLTEQEIKRIEIDILKEIDSICSAQSLKYTIMYGTLLGSVRHKGFIPWDDDIDIIMPRNDYNRLLSIVKNDSSTPDWLEILDASKSGYFYPFAKAVDNRTIAKMESNTTEHGVWVDIFPVDNVPKNTFLSHCYMDLCLLFREATIAMTTDNTLSETERIKEGYRRRLRFLRWFSSVIGKRSVCSLYTMIISLFNRKASGRVAVLWASYRYRELFDSEILFEQTDLQFEDTVFKGPKNYDFILTQLYGDYQTLPPVEKRRTHGITAWKKQASV